MTPTTKDISDNITAQLEAQLNQTIPLLPKAFNRVLAKTFSGVFIILYKYIGFMALQIFIRTATTDETVINGVTIRPLIEWGRLFRVGDPLAATYAELSIAITVESQGGTLSEGTHLINSTTGVVYSTIEDVSLDSDTKYVTIRAVSDINDGGGSGTPGNMSPGETVSFVSPLNVSQVATVDSVVVTATDAESTDSYRQRILNKAQKMPQGGAYADYEEWGLEVPGILHIYPYSSTYPGIVDVYVEATVDSAGNEDGYPTNAQLTAVYNSIELSDNGMASRRPANARVDVFSIHRSSFDVEVTGLTVSVPSIVKVQIDTAIKEYLYSAEPFIPGLSILPRKDVISKMELGGVINDIVKAAGGTFTDVGLYLDNVATDIYTLSIGEKAKLGSVEYIA